MFNNLLHERGSAISRVRLAPRAIAYKTKTPLARDFWRRFI